MRPRRPLARIARALALAGALAGLAGAAQAQAQDRVQLERRLQSVGTLIDASSAARQIESSAVPAARDKRDNARLIHREAAAALQQGDLAAAARLLDQAAREMMDGARLALPEQVHGAKAQRDFDARLASARALLDAQRRITQEKGSAAEALATAAAVAAQIEQARQLAAADRLAEARPVLDKAYLTARVSIEAMRRGDTLVRSLHFGSPREEFDYEVDRNDTHRLLIGVLLADRKDSPGTLPAAMQGFVDRATGLRGEADAQARRGDHPAAIRLLEQSTRELVRAIRAGGLYIPG